MITNFIFYFIFSSDYGNYTYDYYDDADDETTTQATTTTRAATTQATTTQATTTQATTPITTASSTTPSVMMSKPRARTARPKTALHRTRRPYAGLQMIKCPAMELKWTPKEVECRISKLHEGDWEIIRVSKLLL